MRKGGVRGGGRIKNNKHHATLVFSGHAKTGFGKGLEKLISDHAPDSPTGPEMTCMHLS